MENALCTPHLGYVEEATYEAYYGTAIDRIVACAAGKPVNVLNPEALQQCRGGMREAAAHAPAGTAGRRRGGAVRTRRALCRQMF